MKPSTVREGVKWLPGKNIDVFFVTLNKTDKDYSPTTMYNDYSINSELFHWQSQSTTLGTANYVKHDGEKPMNITWKLDHSIPAKYLKKLTSW